MIASWSDSSFVAPPVEYVVASFAHSAKPCWACVLSRVPVHLPASEVAILPPAP